MRKRKLSNSSSQETRSQRKRLRSSQEATPSSQSQKQRRDSSQASQWGSQSGDEETEQRTVGEKNLAKITKEEKEKLVADTVRFFLFMDIQKLPVKRADITKNVTKEYKSVTTAVIEIAKEHLSNIFGYELIEVWRLSTSKEGRTVKKNSTGTFILKNKLHQSLAALGGDVGLPGNEEERKTKAFLMIILTILFLHKGPMEKEAFDAHLGRLTTTGEEIVWMENTIKLFLRQLYIEKISIINRDATQTISFDLGPRAEIEIGKKIFSSIYQRFMEVKWTLFN